MGGLKIGGYELVVTALAENLTLSEAIGRMSHNLREPKQAKRIKYLRSKSNKNRYFSKNQFGNLMEVSNVNHENELEKITKKFDNFKSDYEKQTITDKNGRIKKRAWQKKMTPFTEVLLTFGTTRPKTQKEGLNQAESNFINSLNVSIQAQKFAND